MTGDVTLRAGMRLIGRAVRDEPHRFAIAVAGSAFYSVLTVVSAYVLGAVVGQVVLPAFEAGRADVGALTLGASVIVAIAVGRLASLFARRLGASSMQLRLQARYRRAVVRRYLRLPLSWHREHSTGTLLSNANADVEAAWVIIAPLPFAVGTLVMLAAGAAALISTDWVFALVGAALFPLLLGLNVVFSRLVAPRTQLAQRLRAEVSGVAHESFDGALVVKTTGMEAAETHRFQTRSEQLRDAMISVGRIRGMFNPLLDMLPNVATLGVLLIGAVRLRQGTVTVTEMASVAFLFTLMAFPVRAVGWVLADLPRAVVGWERIQQVLAATGDVEYGERTLPDTADPAELTLSGVRFGYLDGTDVLDGVELTVPAGQTVALVGPTGAGKSTVAALAARLVDPLAGTVWLDQVDVRELTQAELTATVGLVPQIPFVFDDTVRGNITLDRPGITDEEIWQSLKLAQLARFVEELPDRLDTLVGERGASLSGGQRQRLALARALAGRPRLLIVDDATSAVDPRVEAAILAGLRNAAQGASILVVAYRRATIALADQVVFLDRGKVVARGTHAQLLATAPGYVDLVTAYERAEQERWSEPAAGSTDDDD